MRPRSPTRFPQAADSEGKGKLTGDVFISALDAVLELDVSDIEYLKTLVNVRYAPASSAPPRRCRALHAVR